LSPVKVRTRTGLATAALPPSDSQVRVDVTLPSGKTTFGPGPVGSDWDEEQPTKATRTHTAYFALRVICPSAKRKLRVSIVHLSGIRANPTQP
jgi:hypothetical protein